MIRNRSVSTHIGKETESFGEPVVLSIATDQHCPRNNRALNHAVKQAPGSGKVARFYVTHYHCVGGDDVLVRHFVEQFACSAQIPTLEVDLNLEIVTVRVGIEACLDHGSVDIKVSLWRRCQGAEVPRT